MGKKNTDFNDECIQANKQNPDHRFLSSFFLREKN